MDEIVSMTHEINELLLIGLTIAVKGAAYMLPEHYRMIVHYLYNGLIGLGDFMGYLLAAVYFFSLDVGQGHTICQVFKMGEMVVQVAFGVLNSTLENRSTEAAAGIV